MQNDATRRRHAAEDRGRVRQSRVAASVPDPSDAHAANFASTHRATALTSILPVRLQRFEAIPVADPGFEALTGDCRRAGNQCVPQSELESIESDLVSEQVVHGLLSHRSLWDAESAKRSGRCAVRVDGHCGRSIIGNDVGTRAVNRNAVGHGWPPRRVRTRVELSIEANSEQSPVGIGAGIDCDARRMTLRRRTNRFVSAVPDAHRPTELDRRQRHEWLDRQVEFASEPTTNCRRNHSDAVLR